MVENAFDVVGHEEIFVAVIVVVADANALPPAGVYEACFFGYVGKCAVVIVMVEMICRSGNAGRRLQGRTVHDENVGPAVVVVVEDCDASASGLDDVFFCIHPAKSVFCG